MPSALRQQVEAMGIMSSVQNIMPIILAIFVSMTSTTAASLSLEGKNRWIMCSVPTRARTVYHSKIAVKGGAISVLATIGGGIASSFIPLYLCMIFLHYQIIIMLGITCLILLATLAIYYKVCRTQLYV